LPQRSSLRSGLYCPCPSTLIDLIRPTHVHSPISQLTAGYTKSLCCAGAPRPPVSGSELSLLILVSMQPSMTTKNPPVAYTQFPSPAAQPSSPEERFGVLIYPTTVRYQWDRLFAANGSRLSLQPADLLAPLTDPTLLTLCRLGLLLRSFRQERSLSPPSGMTTVATGQVLLAGSSPAGLAASFAAPSGLPVIQPELDYWPLFSFSQGHSEGRKPTTTPSSPRSGSSDI
jgi:hypothetical protein